MAIRMAITLDFSEPRVGLWCDTCALPSVLEIDIIRLKADGVQRVGSVRRCANGPHEEDA